VIQTFLSHVCNKEWADIDLDIRVVSYMQKKTYI